MKLTLPKLPVELTEVGWRPQHAVFQNNTGLASQLHIFEAKYAAAQRDTPEDKFPALCQELLRAHQVLLKAAKVLLAVSSKSPIIPKASVAYVKKVHDACERVLTIIQRAYHDAEEEVKAAKEAKAAAKKPGRGEVRIQLQESHNHLWDGVPPTTSARDTIDVLNRLYRENKTRFNDEAWEKGLVGAIHKITGLIVNAKNSGGMKPRGSGNQLRATFEYAKKEYRLDVELHGDDEGDFFL